MYTNKQLKCATSKRRRLCYSWEILSSVVSSWLATAAQVRPRARARRQHHRHYHRRLSRFKQPRYRVQAGFDRRQEKPDGGCMSPQRSCGLARSAHRIPCSLRASSARRSSRGGCRCRRKTKSKRRHASAASMSPQLKRLTHNARSHLPSPLLSRSPMPGPPSPSPRPASRFDIWWRFRQRLISLVQRLLLV